MRLRLVIFDADDTLRRTTVPGQPCPHAPCEWELLPGVRERLARFRWGADGLQLGIASNQDHVGYGLLDEAMARRLLADMVAAAFGPVDPPPRIELCPHTADAGCRCRKPMPGMLVTIMNHYTAAPAETLFVGNGIADRDAATNAGVRFVWAQRLFPRTTATPPRRKIRSCRNHP